MMFLLMDINLFLVIPLTLVWDVFLMKQESSSDGQYLKRQVITGIIFTFFAIVFLVAYFIFNKYINIDQLKNKLQEIAEEGISTEVIPKKVSKATIFDFISNSST
jgi:hypothetical protein